jgi:3-oxoacyl-(acyl-carrier-protein) synthase/pyruvate/2-oxoglutarate dehydrogenase complex dihydrolipoamide acyltransferase (E2) component
MTNLVVPQIGEGIVEVRIVALAKRPGESVARDEVVYELEHDKAAVEMESPCAGVLTRWLVAAGDVVPVGTPVAVIGAAAPQVRVHVPPRTRLFARRAGLTDEQLRTVPAAATVLTPDDVRAYLARRDATPTHQPDGVTPVADADRAEPGPPAEAVPGPETIPLSTRQQRLNAAMRHAAGRVVPASVAVSLDADALDRLVQATGSDPATPLQAFAHLVARVASAHPRLRALRLDDASIAVRDRVDLGVAVATDDGDLTVAVVPGADRLAPGAFAEAYTSAVTAARRGGSGSLAAVPLIVTHLGDDSATFAVPVVVEPAVAALFLGAREGTTRQMVLSFDHCVMNGQEAVRFLTDLRDAVAPPREVPPPAPGTDPLSAAVAVASSVLGRRVDPGRPLGEQGMDSSAALRLTRELGRVLAVAVPATALWRHPRLRDLVAGLGLAGPAVAAGGYDRRPEPSVSPAATSDGPGDRPQDIAVIGMSCAVSGADDVDAYWALLERGECRIGPVPPARAADVGDGVTAAFLDRIDLFDADFFGINPRQATAMDPQQRMLLELSWHALQHAGIEPGGLAGTDVGVFAAACSYDYRERVTAVGEPDGYATVGTFPAFLANRISHHYDLTGPSVTVDTACSGGLTAVALAVAALRAGDCAMALVGAANLLSNTFNSTAYQRAGMLSPHGHSRVFDAAADGFVRGEGAGWVVLKPLRQARAAGDPVLAVLRGVAVNHGGRAASLTAPNPSAQSRLIRRALEQAGLPASAVGYLEAHGTGTALGDPIEVEGVVGALAGSDGTVPVRAGGPEGRLWIGSAKANIGHLEGASGLLGLIKAILVLRNGVIPPTAGFARLNGAIDLSGTPLAVADRRCRGRVTGRSAPWR